MLLINMNKKCIPYSFSIILSLIVGEVIKFNVDLFENGNKT